MNWAIVYLAGACCMVSSSCARKADGSSLRVLRVLGSVLLLGGGILMLVGGSFVEVLLVGALCAVVMAFATWSPKSTTTSVGWFVIPGLLIIASIVLLSIRGPAPKNTGPRIIFDEASLRHEQLVILDDAWTELELLDERGFPQAIQEARTGKNWTQLGDLETVRSTLPLLRARITELRQRLADELPNTSSGQEVRAIAERISRIDQFVNKVR